MYKPKTDSEFPVISCISDYGLDNSGRVEGTRELASAVLKRIQGTRDSMATSSISSTLFASLPVPGSSTYPAKTKSGFVCLPSLLSASKLKPLKHSQSQKVSAAPEVLDSQETLDGFESSPAEVC